MAMTAPVAIPGKGIWQHGLVPNGRYVAKYQLLLPKELVDHG